jgi:hypothetical protein
MTARLPATARNLAQLEMAGRRPDVILPGQRALRESLWLKGRLVPLPGSLTEVKHAVTLLKLSREQPARPRWISRLAKTAVRNRKSAFRVTAEGD